MSQICAMKLGFLFRQTAVDSEFLSKDLTGGVSGRDDVDIYVVNIGSNLEIFFLLEDTAA